MEKLTGHSMMDDGLPLDASSATFLADDISCRYCLRKAADMEDPRQLPCHHVFCYQCIKSDFTKLGPNLKCPNCGSVQLAADIDKLEPYTIKETTDKSVDSLLTKVNSSQKNIQCEYSKCTDGLAVSFCQHCKKAMCISHEKKHYDLYGDEDGHNKISLKYHQGNILTSKKGTSTCHTHSYMDLLLGCEICHQVFCEKCDYEQECQGNSILGKLAIQNKENLTKGSFGESKVLTPSSLLGAPPSLLGSSAFAFGTSSLLRAPPHSTGASSLFGKLENRNTDTLAKGLGADGKAFDSNSPFGASAPSTGASSLFGKLENRNKDTLAKGLGADGKAFAGNSLFGASAPSTGASSLFGKPVVQNKDNLTKGSGADGKTFAASSVFVRPRSAEASSLFGKPAIQHKDNLTRSSGADIKAFGASSVLGAQPPSTGASSLFQKPAIQDNSNLRKELSADDNAFAASSMFGQQPPPTGPTSLFEKLVNRNKDTPRSVFGQSPLTGASSLFGITPNPNKDSLKGSSGAGEKAFAAGTVFGAPHPSTGGSLLFWKPASQNKGAKQPPLGMICNSLEEQNTLQAAKNPIQKEFQMTGFVGLPDPDPFREKESGHYRMSNISLPSGPILDRSSGKKLHRLLPVKRLESKIQEDADVVIANLLATETDICKADKQSLRNIELNEKNIESIMDEVDMIIEEKVELLLEQGKKFKDEVSKRLACKASEAHNLLGLNSAHRDDIVSCQAKFSELLNDYDQTEMITSYSCLEKEAREISQRRISRFDCSIESLQHQSNVDIQWSTSSYNPRSLRFIKVLPTRDPVTAVEWLASSSLAIGYRKKIEIVNIIGECLHSIAFETGQLVDMSCFSDQMIVWLERANESNEEIRVNVFNSLDGQKTIHLLSLDASPTSHIFCTQSRLLITNETKNIILVLDKNGRSMRELRTREEMLSLLAVDHQKGLLFFTSQEGLVKAHATVYSNEVVNAGIFQWMLPSFTDALSKDFQTFKVKKEEPKSDTRSVAQKESIQPSSEATKQIESLEALLSAPEQDNSKSNTDIIHGEESSQKRDRAAETKTEIIENLISTKCPDENGFFYVLDLPKAVIYVISHQGLVSSIIHADLNTVTNVTGISVYGGLLLMACGAQGIKMYSLR